MARNAGLDVPRIVQAALAIADREGLDRLTMRRLSVELGVTPMATYHHVSGKEELLDLVIDESIGQVREADPDGDPLDELVAWFSAFHDLLVEHPALAQAAGGRRVEGPQALQAARAMTQVCERAGVDGDTAVELVIGAFGFALGGGLYSASRRAARRQEGGRTLPPLDSAPAEDRDLLARFTDEEANAARFRRGLTLLIAGYLERPVAPHDEVAASFSS